MNIKAPHVDKLKTHCRFVLLGCRIYESHRSHDSLYISVRPPLPLLWCSWFQAFHFCCVWFSQRPLFLFHTLFVCVCVCERNEHYSSQCKSRDSSAGAFPSSGRALRIAAAPSGESDELWIIIVNKRRGGWGALTESPLSICCRGLLFIHSSIYLSNSLMG